MLPTPTLLHSLRRHLCWQIPPPPHSSHSLRSCRCCLIGALRLCLTVSGLLRHQLGREPTVKEVLNRAPLQPHHQHVHTACSTHGVSWAQSHIYSKLPHSCAPPTQLRTRQLTAANSQSHSIQLTPIPQHTATVCTATSTTQRSAHPSVVVVACHGYCGQLEAIPLSIGQDAEGKVNFADMLGSL